MESMLAFPSQRFDEEFDLRRTPYKYVTLFINYKLKPKSNDDNSIKAETLIWAYG